MMIQVFNDVNNQQFKIYLFYLTKFFMIMHKVVVLIVFSGCYKILLTQKKQRTVLIMSLYHDPRPIDYFMVTLSDLSPIRLL